MPKYRVIVSFDDYEEIVEASSKQEAEELAYDPYATGSPDIFVEKLSAAEIAEIEEQERLERAAFIEYEDSKKLPF